MRGIDVVVNSRVYLRDNTWLLGIAKRLTSENESESKDNKRNGTSDAVAWLRKEIDRLQQRVTWLEVDNASKFREVKELRREKEKCLRFESALLR